MKLLGIFIVFSTLFLAIPGIISYHSGAKKKGRTLLRLSLLITIAYVIFNIFIIKEKVGDASLYAKQFKIIRASGLLTALRSSLQENGFILITWLISKVTSNYNIYRMILFFINLCLIWLASKKIKIEPFYMIIISYLWYVFFLAYTMAAIRQGVSMCVFLYLLSGLVHEERELNEAGHGYKHGRIKVFVFLLLMLSLHRSSILMVPGIIILYLSVIKKYGGKKLSLYLSFAAIIISIVMLLWGNIENFFEKEYYSRMIEYSTPEAKQRYGVKGIRFDFIIFNTAPLLISGYLYLKKKRKFNILIASYIYAYLAFIPFSTISHSDRIAAYTFIQIPLLLFSIISELKQKMILQIIFISTFISTGFLRYWEIYLDVQGY